MKHYSHLIWLAPKDLPGSAQTDGTEISSDPLEITSTAFPPLFSSAELSIDPMAAVMPAASAPVWSPVAVQASQSISAADGTLAGTQPMPNKLAVHWAPAAVHGISGNSIASKRIAPSSETPTAEPTPQEGEADGLTADQISTLIDGLTEALANLETSVIDQVFAETLPVVGNNFASLAGSGAAQMHYVGTLKTAIVDSGLGALTGPGPFTKTQVEGAINSALSNAAIGGFSSLDLTDAADVKLNFFTSKTNYAALPVPVEGNLGLPNLALQISGTAQSDFDYRLNFSTGVDAGGFYLGTAPGQSFFSIVANTTLPGFTGNATLAPTVVSSLRFTAADAGTLFNGNFSLTIKDPGTIANDGKVRVGETGDLIDATISGFSDIKLQLTTDMGGAAVPQLSTKLGVASSFSGTSIDVADGNEAFGSQPLVTFQNTIDLGSFFHGFASPVLKTVSDLAKPFLPLIDALTAKIPLLDILNDVVPVDIPETLLDLVGVEPAERDALKGLSEIAGLLQLANDATGTATIQLGTLRVNGDLRTTPLGLLSTSLATAPPAPGTQDAYLGNFLSVAANLGAGGELSFPILQQPALMGDLLLGKGNPEFFDYDPAGISIDPVSFRQFFPVLGPFGVTLGGSVGFKADFDFGFDTQGLRDFARSGDVGDVFNGFFVRAFNDAGDPVTYVGVAGGLDAGVAVNVIIAEVAVVGGLDSQVLLAFDQDFADAEGKVRGHTITTQRLEDLFAPSGEISAGLEARVTVGIDPFEKEWSFPIAHTVLWTSGQATAEGPVLINQLPDNSLRLNTGPRAELRERGNIKDTAEHFQVSYVETLNDALVVVKAFNRTDFVRADPVDTLVANGGNFADILETTADFPLPVIFAGGGASDTLISGKANDLLSGGVGNDTLIGNEGDDTLSGDEGDDVLVGGPGADTLYGGEGRDVAAYHTSPIAITVDLRSGMGNGDAAGDTFSGIEGIIGSPFDDVIEGSNGDDAPLVGGAGADTISGNDGNDVIDGGEGADTIYGGAGDDFIFAIADTGGDLIFGGEGIDTISFINSPTTALVNLGANFSDGNTLLQFENIVGTLLHVDEFGQPEFPGDDLTGNDGPNVIYGLDGNDRLDGKGGDDVLYGNAPGLGSVRIFGDLADPDLPEFAGSDADKLYGGAGNDSLFGGASADELYGEDGDDLLDGETGDDHLVGGAGADRLIGGEGNDTLYGGNFGGEPGAPSDDFLDGGEGDDKLIVQNGNNQLFGQGGDDILSGGVGNDLLDGGDGWDNLNGGSGNNLMFGGPGNDSLFALDGDDVMDGGEGDDMLDAQAGNNTLHGGNGNDTLAAAFGNDTIYGDDGNDTIDGGIGRNFLYGGAGNDSITASFNDDYMEGNDGDDLLNAQGGNNSLFGGAGRDTLLTSGGNDILNGGDDHDFLDAGNGTDRLTGGAGNDVLIAGSLRAETRDIQLSDHLFGGAGFDTITADFSNQTVAMSILIGADNSLQFADGAEALNFENLRDFASGSGNDVIRLDGLLDDGFGNFLLTGAGNDVVFSGAGNDVVDAGDGDDFVNGGSNNSDLSFPNGVPSGTLGDTLHGGFGNDTVSFAGIVQFQNGFRLGAAVNLATNATGLGASGTVISGFENVIGTDFRDELIGDSGPNIFHPLRGGGYGPSGGFMDPDQIDGAGGEDTLVIDFSAADLANALGVVTAGAGFYRNTIGNLGLLDTYSYANIEHLEITGASKNDVIYPVVYGFADVLRGLGGNDVLGGFGGSDTLLGGEGNDVLTGQGQFALGDFNAAGGHDVFDAGPGDDIVENHGLRGTTFLLDSATALFQLDGGAGFDSLGADFSNQSAAIVWDSRAPTDVDFADGAYFRGFEQLRSFATGSGNDSLTQLGRLNNVFNLGTGDDVARPGLGFDEVFGGSGDDLLILDFSVGDDATVTGISGAGDGRFISRQHAVTNDYVDYTNNFGFERLQIIASIKNDDLAGFLGDDVIDVLRGNDRADGRAGNDLLRLDWSAMVSGSQGARYTTFDLSTGSGTLTTSDASGFQIVFSNFERFELRGTELGDDLRGAGLADTLVGGGGDDLLSGGAGADVLDGGPGNDTLVGGPGADLLRGGDGDDIYVIDTIADIIAGESPTSGNDTVRSIVDYVLGPNLEHLILEGRALNGVGNALANILTGNARNNYLQGGEGNDVLKGGTAIGLSGSEEVDRLHGGPGADIFVLGDADSRFYDDRSSLSPGTTGFARIEDFSPSQGDQLRLKGSAAEYLLGPSGVAAVPGIGLFHDTNANGAFDTGHDELLAILDSLEPVTHANTIDAAHFV